MRAADRLFLPTLQATCLRRVCPPPTRPVSALHSSGLPGKGWIPVSLPLRVRRPELALQALRQVGAIDYHSSFKTGLNHELEQAIIRRIRDECLFSPERAGGAAIWEGAQGPALPAASGGKSGADRRPAIPYSPAIQTEFDRFVDVLSGQDPPADDRGAAGRSEPSPLPEAGGGSAGLQSPGFTARAILERGLRNPPMHKI